MRFVLDASVTLCWCYGDEAEPVAERAGQALVADGRAHVPSLWWYEVRNALNTGMRRNRASQNEIETFLADLARLKIQIYTDLPNELAIFDLARRHRLTFYDAAYLELARRERLPLATLDQALVKAAVDEGIALVTA